MTQPTVAGVPAVVRNLVRDQRAAGWEVLVAAPDDGDLAGWLEEIGVPHLSWPAARQPGATVPAEVLRLRRILRTTGPAVVHLHSAKAGLAGRLALRGRIPTVYQPHAWSFEATGGLVGSAARTWEASASRWTDLVVCVSGAEERLGVEAGVTARTVVIPNGVDLERFREAGPADRRSARLALGLPERPTVVCVGRLTEQKGQDVLLAGTPALVRRVPDVQVVLVGDGPSAAEMRRTGPPGVVFAGNQRDVRPWLQAADVVAAPSRWEAGSLVLLEAMAVGRSVVSTPVGGAGSLLVDAGAVVPVDDPDALSEALAIRLENPSLARQEGAAGRRRVEAEHDLARASERVREAYGLVLRPGR